MPARVSVVIPAKNEAITLGAVIADVQRAVPGAEIVVVDDGSADGTDEVARQAGAIVVRHPISRGNGAAVKAGARRATGDYFVFMDGDGQHDAAEIPRLLERLESGNDLVVGARAQDAHAGIGRWLANSVYNTLASWLTGVRITDLTSGFRAARAELFRQFLPLLPNGFSYPTTITMAFLRAGYSVTFEPIRARQRAKDTKSHIRPLLDGGRFLIIIFKVGTLYSPLKIFFPISIGLFVAGVGYYAYTFLTAGRFTNLGALLFSTSMLVFLIGLISEQITTLIYVGLSDRDRQA